MKEDEEMERGREREREKENNGYYDNIDDNKNVHEIYMYI
jgi:hypothetical protein